MTRTRLLLIGCCFATLSGLAASIGYADSDIGSQAVGRVVGTVFSHHEPVADAAVYLYSRDESEVLRTLTTDHGAFKFVDLQPAKYILIVESPFGRAQVDVEVRGGVTTRKRIAL